MPERLEILRCEISGHWISVQRVRNDVIYCLKDVHVHLDNIVTCDCQPTEWFPDEDSALEYALFHWESHHTGEAATGSTALKSHPSGS